MKLAKGVLAAALTLLPIEALAEDTITLGLFNRDAAIIAAELVAAQSGLGFLIANGMDILRADEVLAGMVVIGILGLLFDAFFRYLQRRFGYVD